MKRRRKPRLPILLALPLFLVAAIGCSTGSTPSDIEPPPPPPQTGGMDIDVSGVPAGVDAGIQITGPNSYSQTVNASTVLTGLTPGIYMMQIAPVLDGDWQYTPSQTNQQVTIAAGAPRPVSVNFTAAQVRGSLAIAIEGLPAGADALIQVTGPGGFEQTVTQTDTLRSLVPGSYAVSATMVAHEGTNYVPFPENDTATVAEGNMAASFVTYGEQSGNSTLDLWVDHIEVIQATQRDAGGVPMVRDRDALLRIYGLANEINLANPDVRVEFYINGLLQQTEVSTTNQLSTPRNVDRGDLSSTWNVVIPASLVQPNLGIRVEIDPDNRFEESLESNNRYPGAGLPELIPVASMDELQLRLVPMVTPDAGQGDVDVGNADQYLTMARKLYPFPNIDVDVRAPFTPSLSGPLMNNDANGAWFEALEALNVLRTSTDISDRYYYGVVATTYSSGVAGLGYVPFSRTQGYNSAMGWDKVNSRAGVMAHELGHNLGRPHSPCGGAASPDPGYPHAGASIGVWGYDLSADQLKDPAEYTDIMGYCNPQWISDYCFEQILDFMGGVAARRAAPPTTCLLVWGNVVDGVPTLRPAFLVNARPRLPERGDYQVTARGADGELLLRVSFDPVPVADHPDGDRASFAFTIPVSSGQANALARLELTGRGSSVQQVSERALAKQAPTRVPYRLLRLGGDVARLEWDAQSHPMVMVRDARTRELIALLGGGGADFVATGPELEIAFSDGVQSVRMGARID